MQIIEKPTFRILTPKDELKNQLLRIEESGRTCYQSFTGPITEESATKFVRMIMNSGHESVIEHTSMTVGFYGVSRGFTHEMVRHRLAAYSQESTRYVDYAKGEDTANLERFQMEMVIPAHKDKDQRVDLGDGRVMTPVEMAEEIELFYRSLRKSGWLPEDARQCLPTGLVSDLVATTNFREWRHIFKMRTQKAAHWEIRRVMSELLEEVKQVVPVIFEDFAQQGVDKNGLVYYGIIPRETKKV